MNAERRATRTVASAIAGIVLSWCAVVAAHGAEASPLGQVAITADTLTHEATTQRYSATGNVKLTWDGLTLTSREAQLDMVDNRARAEGDVLLVRDGERLRGDRLSVDMATETGDISNGELFIKKNNMYVRGRTMSKVGQDEYRIDRGSITTCDGESPSWKFTASDIDLSVSDYGTATNALFYIKDLPLFYFPYLIFPTNRDRQTGFLIPRAGNSSVKGFNFAVPFYWAATPNQDVVIEPEYQSKRGFGMGLDYRYILKLGSEGSFRGYGMYDTASKQMRGEILQKHQERFSDTLIFKSDVRYVSDNNYYRDFGVSSGEYNLRKTESTAFATNYWKRFSLTGKAVYIQDLQATSNRETLQTLPSVVLSGMKQQLWQLPLYATVDTTLSNFYREGGVRGQRFSLHPQLTLYLGQLSSLQLLVWGGYQQRLYNTYGGDASHGGFSLGLADAGAQLSTSFDRVFAVRAGSLEKIRHQVVPEVSYQSVPDRDQGRLPFFDYDDRIVGQNTITYGISNYLIGRFAGDGQPAYRTLLYLRLSQRYNPGGIRRDYQDPVQGTTPFGTVRIEAQSNPLPRFSLALDSRFEPSDFSHSSTSLSGDYKDDGGNSAGAGYYFARGNESAVSAEEKKAVEYLEGRLGLGLIKPFAFNFSARYSFETQALLESYYALEYKHQCWSIIFSYRDRPGNKEFLVNFTLAGIGVKGPVRAF